MYKLSTLFLVALVISECFCNYIIPLNYQYDPRVEEALRLAKKATTDSISLNGGFFLGLWYASVTVAGSNFLVQVDTGSSDLLIYEKSCTTCAAAAPNSPRYTPSANSILVACHNTNPTFRCPTCANVTNLAVCGYTNLYGDGSVASGYVIEDTFTIGGVAGFSAFFGPITVSKPQTNGGPFEPDTISGIWGLAYKFLSSWRVDTVFDRLVQSTGMYNGFSMCLSSGAIMTMGISYAGDANFVWTPILQTLYYSVQLNGISLNGVGIYSGGSLLTIVDSGTTQILLDSTTYATFKSKLLSMAQTTTLVGITGQTKTIFDGNCFVMSSTQQAAYPALTIQINGVSDFTLTGSQYLKPISSGGNTYMCMGVSDSGGSQILLGDVFMQNYHVVFDRAQGKIGFGPTSTCPTVTSTATGLLPSAAASATIGGSYNWTIPSAANVLTSQTLLVVAALLATLMMK